MQIKIGHLSTSKQSSTVSYNLQYKVWNTSNFYFRSSLSKLVEREEIGKIFAVVGICQAVISLAGYRYFIIGGICQSLAGYRYFLIGDLPSCHPPGRIQVLYYCVYQAAISLAGYRYFIIGDMPRCHLSGRIQVLYY